MQTYDIVLALVVIAGILQGAWRGLAWQAAPIASLVLGYVVAFPLSEDLAPWFGEQAPTNRYLAMLVLYLAVSLSVYLLASSFKQYIVRLKLEEYDRHLGSIFGGFKALLFALVVTFFAVALSPTARDHVLQTRSGYAFAVVLDKFHSVMPQAMHDVLDPYIHRVDSRIVEDFHDHDGAESAGIGHNQTADADRDRSILEAIVPALKVGVRPDQEHAH